jgi:WD40 repeat protein
MTEVRSRTESEQPGAAIYQRIPNGINQIATSSDKRVIAYSNVSLLVTVEHEGSVIFQRDFTSTNDKIRPTQRVRGLGFSSDGRLLYLAAGDELSALDWQTGQVEWKYVAPRSFGFMIISPTAIALHDGLVAASFDNGSIGVWTGDGVLQSLWRDNDAPRQLSFSADGKRIIGTDSFSLCAWDRENGTRLLKMRLRDRAYGFASSKSQNLIALRGLSSVDLRSSHSGVIEASLPTTTGLPLVAWHPTEDVLAVTGTHEVNVFDSRGVQHAQSRFDDAAISICFTSDGSRLLVGGAELTTFEFDRRDLRKV